MSALARSRRSARRGRGRWRSGRVRAAHDRQDHASVQLRTATATVQGRASRTSVERRLGRAPEPGEPAHPARRRAAAARRPGHRAPARPPATATRRAQQGRGGVVDRGRSGSGCPRARSFGEGLDDEPGPVRGQRLTRRGGPRRPGRPVMEAVERGDQVVAARPGSPWREATSKVTRSPNPASAARCAGRRDRAGVVVDADEARLRIRLGHQDGRGTRGRSPRRSPGRPRRAAAAVDAIERRASRGHRCRSGGEAGAAWSACARRGPPRLCRASRTRRPSWRPRRSRARRGPTRRAWSGCPRTKYGAVSASSGTILSALAAIG